MQDSKYNVITNSFEMLWAELTYPTINMLKSAVKMQVKGLFMSGISGNLMYL